MSLTPYKRKRNFKATPEPKGTVRRSRSPLRFVVQKHAASHVHYDFRLELDGVLKSWAVPKGPSMNPSEKRLAHMVEDHPLEYRTYEGSIPEGSYGAGEVIVWDEGTYHAAETSDRLESIRILRRSLEEGKLTFFLQGKKLKGGFALIRTAPPDRENWLLIKRQDRYADVRDIREDILSVRSGKKLPGEQEYARDAAVRGDGRARDVKGATITHPDKLYWPEEEITKGDLADYYRKVSRYILPYLLDRPQSLHRFPNGIQEEGFYQKDVGARAPAWLETVEIPLETDRRKIRYLVCKDEASLLYMVNLGCIEMHPWFSRVGKLDNPDYLVLDLDPEGIGFDAVVETALAVKKTLDRAGAKSFCKTSGATGLHIFVPLKGKYDYDVARNFAQLIAGIVNNELPRLTSLERSPGKRKRKVYIDYLQNTKAQTVVAPYSVRPRPGAPVSTPLEWDEVRHGLDPASYTVKTIVARLKEKGDLFRKVLGPAVDIEAGLEKLGDG